MEAEFAELVGNEQLQLAAGGLVVAAAAAGVVAEEEGMQQPFVVESAVAAVPPSIAVGVSVVAVAAHVAAAGDAEVVGPEVGAAAGPGDVAAEPDLAEVVAVRKRGQLEAD